MVLSQLVTKIKYKFRPIVPNFLWKFLEKASIKRRNKQFSEITITNDSAEVDQKVYVIRRRPPGGGLFSNVNHVMQGLEYARNRGYIPIVDMENYWTTYSQLKSFNRTHNAWEYFFQPTSSVKLHELKSFNNITFSKGDRINEDSILADKSLGFVFNGNDITYLHDLYLKYINLNEITLKFIDNVKEYIEWEERTAGIFYRGTDYLTLKPRYHARQPDLDKFLPEVSKKVESQKYVRFLISTEDLTVRERISDELRNLAYKSFRDGSLLRKLLPRDIASSPQVLNALGYLAEIYLLSEAQTLVSSVANGSATAIILNGNRYEDPVIFNEGMY